MCIRDSMMSRYHDTMIRTAGNVLELGAAIRDARKRRGWTQAELADKAGVTRHLLTEVERGKRPGAEVSGIMAVARALGMGLALAPLASTPVERSFDAALDELLGGDQ